MEWLLGADPGAVSVKTMGVDSGGLRVAMRVAADAACVPRLRGLLTDGT